MAQYLKKKTFAKVMRGYSPEEVDAYIEYLLKKYTEASAENEENKKRLTAALQKIRALTENGADGPRATPSEASAAESERIVAEAKAEERRIMDLAVTKAERIIRDAEREAREKAVTITTAAQKTAREAEAYAGAQYEAAQKIYTEVFAFRDKLFGMYNDHIELLETVAEEANTYFDTFDSAGAAHPSETVTAADEADGVFVVPSEESVSYKEQVVLDEPEPVTEPEAMAEPEPVTEPEAMAEPEPVTEPETMAEPEPMTEPEFAEVPEPMEEPAFAEEETDAEEAPFTCDEHRFPVTDEADDLLSDEFLRGADLSDTPSTEEENAELSKYLSVIDGVEEEDDLFTEEIFAEDMAPDDIADLSAELRALYDIPAEEAEEEPHAEADEDELPEEEEERGRPYAFSENDFDDLDDLFAKGGKTSGDYSVTDEFDIVYSKRNINKNMEEIVRQPLVAPEAPANPKKHKRF